MTIHLSFHRRLYSLQIIWQNTIESCFGTSGQSVSQSQPASQPVSLHRMQLHRWCKGNDRRKRKNNNHQKLGKWIKWWSKQKAPAQDFLFLITHFCNVFRVGMFCQISLSLSLPPLFLPGTLTLVTIVILQPNSSPSLISIRELMPIHYHQMERNIWFTCDIKMKLPCISPILFYVRFPSFAPIYRHSMH